MESQFYERRVATKNSTAPDQDWRIWRMLSIWACSSKKHDKIRNHKLHIEICCCGKVYIEILMGGTASICTCPDRLEFGANDNHHRIEQHFFVHITFSEKFFTGEVLMFCSQKIFIFGFYCGCQITFPPPPRLDLFSTNFQPKKISAMKDVWLIFIKTFGTTQINWSISKTVGSFYMNDLGNLEVIIEVIQRTKNGWKAMTDAVGVALWATR